MYDRKDSYYRQAKKEGYRSRAAYKLMELNKKFRIVGKGMTVLDAGAAPGGWSQVALDMVGRNGRVVGVDILDMEPIEAPNFAFIMDDLRESSAYDRVLAIADEYDAVISDVAPNTTGQRLLDHVNSVELVRMVAGFADKVLRPGGGFLFKVFDGEDREELTRELKKRYKTVKALRPDATRKGSFEMYIACMGFKGRPDEQG